MATGTGNLPYPSKVYVPFDILTADELNEDVANIEALADGSGIGDGAIGNTDLANNAVTAVKTNFGGNYSTSEVNTGFTWVNSKPVYKRTFTGSVVFGWVGSTNLTTGVETLISASGYIIDEDSVTQNQIGAVYQLTGDASRIRFKSSVQNTSGTLWVEAGKGNSGTTITRAYSITAFYTKV